MAAGLRSPGLEARVASASGGRLRIQETKDRGRCLQAVVDAACGTLLAEEEPLALGSSDGLRLAEACAQGSDFDASEDLLASCVLLHAGVGGELARRATAQELDWATDTADAEDQATLQLHGSLRDDLREAVAIEEISGLGDRGFEEMLLGQAVHAAWSDRGTQHRDLQ
ncbi:unnamed protein product [Prorocentrum cordatum]|uniref:Uncharacterized protein n=1 Tax=Prorocentrum cordatum TaxID=2364126 RepID=A0ABN9TE85_9DINO|nr:unnamed protein product [Polarella glacialis]